MENKNNTLIVGASSNLSYQYIEKYGTQNTNFYGVSSKFDNIFSDSNITIYNYSNFVNLKEINFDEVLILASRLPSDNVVLNDFLETNINIMNVLKILIPKNKNTKITFISTYSVYDPFERILDENSEVFIENDYAYSKLEMEKELANFAENFNFNLLILRMPVLLYKGVKTNFLGRLKNAINNNNIAKLSNSNSTLSLVFDVENIVRLVKADWKGYNLVNCSSSPDITFSDIAVLAKDYGLSELQWVKGNRPSQSVDSSLLCSILGELPSANKIVKNWFKEEFLK